MKRFTCLFLVLVLAAPSQAGLCGGGSGLGLFARMRANKEARQQARAMAAAGYSGGSYYQQTTYQSGGVSAGQCLPGGFCAIPTQGNYLAYSSPPPTQYYTVTVPESVSIERVLPSAQTPSKSWPQLPSKAVPQTKADDAAPPLSQSLIPENALASNDYKLWEDPPVIVAMADDDQKFY